jgi:LDH2 family malate/lactate/ureidoglycolate dehydrogenase
VLRETLRTSGLRWTASLVADRMLPIGLLRLWRDRRVAPDVLRAQLHAVLRAWGMSEEHATVTIGHMLYADLHGIDSHGCAMLLAYHLQRAEGALAMQPAITIVQESETTALVDGGGGLGHVPADLAMRTAIAKCRASGVGVVAVRRSGHFGAAGSYAQMAVREGMIGLALTSVREPAVVPTGATSALFGTNPIAFAAPAGHASPFLLDMATSAAALGKLANAWRRGEPLPEGLALDADGRPQRRARLAFTERRLTPLGTRIETGGHKGYGLAAMVEILSAFLPGVQPRVWFPDSLGGTGHFFLALDVARFRPPAEFGADVAVMIDTLHATPPLDANEPVLVAGDPERAAAEARARDGIPLSRSVVEDLRLVARAAGVDFLLDAQQRPPPAAR